MAVTDELVIKIEATTALLRAELERANKGLDSFGGKVNSRLDKVDKRFQKLGNAVKSSLGLFGIGFGASALATFGRNAINAADQIGAAADRAGFAAERFQRLQFAFEQSDVKSEEFAEGMRRLNRRFGEFLNSGGGPAAAAIRELGLEFRIASGEISNTEQFFDAIVGKLEDVGDASRVSALAAQLFGDDAGPKLVAALRLGTSGLKDLEDAATGVFSQDTIDRASLINDRFNEISRAVGNTLKSAFVNATAAVINFFDQVDGIRLTNTLGQIDTEIERINALLDGISARESFGIRLNPAEVEERNRLLEKRIELLKKITELTTPAAPPPLRPITEEINIEPVARPTPLGNEIVTQSQIDSTRERIRALEIDVLRASGRMEEAIRAAAEAQIEEWRKVAVETPGLADMAARAIELINQKTETEIESLTPALDQLSERAQSFADTFASSFESRGIEAILSGRLSDALKGLTRDFASLVLRLLILRPLAEGLAGAIGGGLFGGGGGFLGGLFGGARASGGPVDAGRAFLVGERGPELFVPNTAGRVIDAARTARAQVGGGLSVNIGTVNADDAIGVRRAVEEGVIAAVRMSSENTVSLMKQIGRPRFA